MRTYFLLAFLLTSAILVAQSSSETAAITQDDMTALVGEWHGNLTYIDYTTNQPYSMPAELIIRRGKDENQLLLTNLYPDEPKANNKSKIKISGDGTMINKRKITKRSVNDEGVVTIEMEYEGKDGNYDSPAQIRQTYQYTETIFIMRKDVKLDGKEDWIKRNEFYYIRQK